MSVKILFMKYLIIALISDFLVDTSLVCGIKCTEGGMSRLQDKYSTKIFTKIPFSFNCQQHHH